MLCISTSFRVLAAPESWLKTFFSRFSTFFDDLNQQLACKAPICWLKITTVGDRLPCRNGSAPAILLLYFSCLKCEKAYFNKHLECAAPKGWSKYTTNKLGCLLYFISYLLHSGPDNFARIIQDDKVIPIYNLSAFSKATEFVL